MSTVRPTNGRGRVESDLAGAPDGHRTAEREQRWRLLRILAVERESTDRCLRSRVHAHAHEGRDLFLSNVSHDMRELYSGLAINAEVILRSSGGEKLKRCADESRRLTARMNRLIDDLLDLA